MGIGAAAGGLSSAGWGTSRRPLISYSMGTFCHNGVACPVTMTREIIRVACSEVTIEALRQLLKDYEAKFREGDEVSTPLPQPLSPIEVERVAAAEARGELAPFACDMGNECYHECLEAYNERVEAFLRKDGKGAGA